MKIQPVTPYMIKNQPDQMCFLLNQLIAQVNALAAKADGGGDSSS